MLVKILRDTIANGVPVAAGDVVEVDESTGRLLVAIHKAEAAPAQEPSEQREKEATSDKAAENPAHKRRRGRPKKDDK
jgi:predicted RNA-binding protein with RPS1 domain